MYIIIGEWGGEYRELTPKCFKNKQVAVWSIQDDRNVISCLLTKDEILTIVKEMTKDESVSQLLKLLDR